MSSSEESSIYDDDEVLPVPLATSTPLSQFGDENKPLFNFDEEKPTYSHVAPQNEKDEEEEKCEICNDVKTEPLSPNKLDLEIMRNFEDFYEKNPYLREKWLYSAPELVAHKIFRMTGVDIPTLIEKRCALDREKMNTDETDETEENGEE